MKRAGQPTSVRKSKTPRQRRSADAPVSQLQRTRFNPEADAAGRVLAGRFRIERLIGRGSMGVVFAARHVELDTRVAIKAILPEMQVVPGVVARFAREAKATVAIRSEHVAQVLDVGTDDALGPFIVMEFLEGRDLRAALELDGKVPLRRAVDYVLQACEALAAAHSRGVIHRDIKPENLFLTRQGNLEVVKLLDFGISKAALTGQLFGGEVSPDDAACLMGTPLYMSPEQIHSLEHVDARADIWSLGAVLYELVTGQSAFSGTADLQVLLKSILEGAPAPLALYSGEADCVIQGVIDQCLQKDAARRFQNVAELASALLPFGSSRARLHAQRAASILGTRDANESSAIASPMPLPAPVPAVSEPLGDTPSGTQSVPAPAARAVAQQGWRSAWPAGFVLGAVVVMLIAAALRGMPPKPGVHAEPVAVPASAPAPEPLASRTVLIETQPSGALVKIEAQAIGVTPLSTLLPAGTVLLTLEKAGYLEARTVIEVAPAVRGAKPILTRVVLQRELAPEPSTPLASVTPLAERVSSATPKPVSAKGDASHVRKPDTSTSAHPPLHAHPEASRPRLRLVQD